MFMGELGDLTSHMGLVIKSCRDDAPHRGCKSGVQLGLQAVHLMIKDKEDAPEIETAKGGAQNTNVKTEPGTPCPDFDGKCWLAYGPDAPTSSDHLDKWFAQDDVVEFEQEVDRARRHPLFPAFEQDQMMQAEEGFVLFDAESSDPLEDLVNFLDFIRDKDDQRTTAAASPAAKDPSVPNHGPCPTASAAAAAHPPNSNSDSCPPPPDVRVKGMLCLEDGMAGADENQNNSEIEVATVPGTLPDQPDQSHDEQRATVLAEVAPPNDPPTITEGQLAETLIATSPMAPAETQTSPNPPPLPAVPHDPAPAPARVASLPAPVTSPAKKQWDYSMRPRSIEVLRRHFKRDDTSNFADERVRAMLHPCFGKYFADRAATTVTGSGATTQSMWAASHEEKLRLQDLRGFLVWLHDSPSAADTSGKEADAIEMLAEDGEHSLESLVEASALQATLDAATISRKLSTTKSDPLAPPDMGTQILNDFKRSIGKKRTEAEADANDPDGDGDGEQDFDEGRTYTSPRIRCNQELASAAKAKVGGCRG